MNLQKQPVQIEQVLIKFLGCGLVNLPKPPIRRKTPLLARFLKWSFFKPPIRRKMIVTCCMRFVNIFKPPIRRKIMLIKPRKKNYFFKPPIRRKMQSKQNWHGK